MVVELYASMDLSLTAINISKKRKTDGVLGVCEAFVYQPGLQNAHHNIEHVWLQHEAPDQLAPVHADIDNALKHKREAVGGMLVEQVWIEGGARGQG